jgi:hypothetical protein
VAYRLFCARTYLSTTNLPIRLFCPCLRSALFTKPSFSSNLINLLFCGVPYPSPLISKAKFDPSSTLVEPTSASRGEAPAALPAASSDPSVLASASTSVTPSSSHTEKEEVKKGPFADGSGHPKANFFFSDMPKAVRLAMRFDTEALYSVTDCRRFMILTFCCRCCSFAPLETHSCFFFFSHSLSLSLSFSVRPK